MAMVKHLLLLNAGWQRVRARGSEMRENENDGADAFMFPGTQHAHPLLVA